MTLKGVGNVKLPAKHLLILTSRKSNWAVKMSVIKLKWSRPVLIAVIRMRGEQNCGWRAH